MASPGKFEWSFSRDQTQFSLMRVTDGVTHYWAPSSGTHWRSDEFWLAWTTEQVFPQFPVGTHQWAVNVQESNGTRTGFTPLRTVTVQAPTRWHNQCESGESIVTQEGSMGQTSPGGIQSMPWQSLVNNPEYRTNSKFGGKSIFLGNGLVVQQRQVQWATVPGAGHWARAYIRSSTNAASNMAWIGFNTLGGTQRYRIRFLTTNLIAINVNASQVTALNGATTIPLDTWFRLEWRADPTNGTFEWRTYTGANVDGTTATETKSATGLTFGGTDGQVLTFGQVLAGTANREFSIDEVEVNTTGWVGPGPFVPTTITPTFLSGSMTDEDRNAGASTTDITINFSQNMSHAPTLNVGDAIPGWMIEHEDPLLNPGSFTQLTPTYLSGQGTSTWKVRIGMTVLQGHYVTFNYTQSTGGTTATTGGAELAATTAAEITNLLGPLAAAVIAPPVAAQVI